MLGELDFYLPKSFCSTNVYGEYTEEKNSIVGLVSRNNTQTFIYFNRIFALSFTALPSQ